MLEGITITEPKVIRRTSRFPPISPINKAGGMLDISPAKTKENDIDEELKKRKKAKLEKKLKEQEGIVNANQQVMVRDRRRPRKSIKEMSVLNKRRRVIKNTARKEIAQQKATLENMRHIELKRYSLEARELDLFVERVRKVKENKRLTMLFSKFESQSEESNDDETSPKSHTPEHRHGKDLSNQTLIPDTEPPDCSTLAEKQKTESMANLLDELNRMSLLIDKDKNPQWEFIMQGRNDSSGLKDNADDNAQPLFGSRYRKNQALEAPGVLQSSISTFPDINDGRKTSKDDTEINDLNQGLRFRRCMSQPIGLSGNSLPLKNQGSQSLPTVTNEEDDQLLEKEKPIQIPDPIPDVTPISKIASYHTNWREREKRGDALYSPVALSPIQNGLMSPDFIMEEDDDLTTKYTKTLNPNRYKTDMRGSGDVEFSQAISNINLDTGNKKAGMQGPHSIIEMQLDSKTKSIADKIRAHRGGREGKDTITKGGTKNIAELIHQSGDGSRFIEEVKLLRQFASMCNCKYLRTDPTKLDERKQSYVDALVDNVSKRVQIRKRWKLGLSINKLPSSQSRFSLPLITPGSSK